MWQNGKSTEHAIPDLYSNVINKAIENHGKPSCIFLDFNKAFKDTLKICLIMTYY